MKKYPEDAVRVYELFVEYSQRIEQILDVLMKEQERMGKQVNELMESMAIAADGNETKTTTGAGNG